MLNGWTIIAVVEEDILSGEAQTKNLTNLLKDPHNPGSASPHKTSNK